MLNEAKCAKCVHCFDTVETCVLRGCGGLSNFKHFTPRPKLNPAYYATRLGQKCWYNNEEFMLSAIKNNCNKDTYGYPFLLSLLDKDGASLDLIDIESVTFDRPMKKVVKIFDGFLGHCALDIFKNRGYFHFHKDQSKFTKPIKAKITIETEEPI